MTNKTFEDIFPSLKGKQVQFPLDFWMKSMKLEFGTNNLHLHRDDVYGITLKDIQQSCLDKQKVRELYKRYEEDLSKVPPNRAAAFDDLMEELKELGL